MRIIETELFTKQRDNIVFYISKDKKSAALNFAKELKKVINNLIHFPYKFRSSFYHKDENIRDMTYRGYSIIYRVNKEKEIIEILEIFNRNLPRVIDEDKSER